MFVSRFSVSVPVVLAVLVSVATVACGGSGSSGFGDINPFLGVSVPFAVWLWAANKVAYRPEPEASTWWVATAVVGATLALNMLLFA